MDILLFSSAEFGVSTKVKMENIMMERERVAHPKPVRLSDLACKTPHIVRARIKLQKEN